MATRMRTVREKAGDMRGKSFQEHACVSSPEFRGKSCWGNR